MSACDKISPTTLRCPRPPTGHPKEPIPPCEPTSCATTTRYPPKARNSAHFRLSHFWGSLHREEQTQPSQTNGVNTKTQTPENAPFPALHLPKTPPLTPKCPPATRQIAGAPLYSGSPIGIERSHNPSVAFSSRKRHIARSLRLHMNWRTAVIVQNRPNLLYLRMHIFPARKARFPPQRCGSPAPLPPRLIRAAPQLRFHSPVYNRGRCQTRFI
jgi:hypothetical protein